MSHPTPEAPVSDPSKALRPDSPGTASPPPSKKVPPEHKSRHRWLLYGTVVVVLVLAGLYWFRMRNTAAAPGKGGAAKAGKGSAGASIPVVGTKAVTGNIGVYVTGLGAITPIYTVTIKSRVDGQLMSVHFKEGDLVNQG